jgi:beta-galactosidase
VRCIDRPTRLADRAYLFEVGVGRGKLMVSGFNFRGALAAKDPAATYSLGQLIGYMIGPEFNPKAALSLSDFYRKAAK